VVMDLVEVAMVVVNPMSEEVVTVMIEIVTTAIEAKKSFYL